MDIFKIAETEEGLTEAEIRASLEESIAGRTLRKVLIIPPDFTRFHSNAGFITQVYHALLTARGAQVDIMPALGTHMPVSRTQWDAMFGDIPYETMLVHDWRHDVVKLGEAPAEYLSDITEGLWQEPVSVEINRRVMDPSYDLIISPGQVVPHEVIGMSNHAKNLFVGVGGSDMINKSHMIVLGDEHRFTLRAFHQPGQQLGKVLLAEELLHRGDAQQLLFIGVLAVGDDLLGHGLFIDILAVRPPFDHLPAGEPRPGQRRLQRVVLDAACPVDQGVHL